MPRRVAGNHAAYPKVELAPAIHPRMTQKLDHMLRGDIEAQVAVETLWAERLRKKVDYLRVDAFREPRDRSCV